MAAPTKAFVNILDTAVDPDSPIDTYLMTGLRDIGIHLKEVLYGAYTATQNHNHDGVNSALVEIGPNAIRNGSFEQDGDGWTITPFTGGSFAFNTANDMDGAKALAITSTSTANGGATATNGEYLPCSGGMTYGVGLMVKASLANVSSRARVIWCDDVKAQISTDDIYTTTNTPIVATSQRLNIAAPSTARFYRVELVGGIPGSGSAFGTIYFDGVFGSGIQDTAAYAVGGYVIGRPANTTGYAVGATVSGSILYSTSPIEVYQAGSFAYGAFALIGVGSWRCVSPAFVNGTPAGFPGLWVRYA